MTPAHRHWVTDQTHTVCQAASAWTAATTSMTINARKTHRTHPNETAMNDDGGASLVDTQHPSSYQISGASRPHWRRQWLGHVYRRSTCQWTTKVAEESNVQRRILRSRKPLVSADAGPCTQLDEQHLPDDRGFTVVIKPRFRRTAFELNSPQRNHPVHEVGDFIVVHASESIHVQCRPRHRATQ